MVDPADRAATLARRAVGRHKALATLLLIAMGAVYVASTASGMTGLWIDLIRAGSEAALVGGLADWFAVTALFRRPLGLPIPHTAVIPSNKDRIGAGLGTFIEQHILEPELLANWLRSAGVSRRLGVWLQDKRNAEILSGHLAVIGGFLLRSLDEETLQRLMHRMLRRQIRELDLGAVFAMLAAELRRSGWHHDLFDYLVNAARQYLFENGERISGIVTERSSWWVPRRIDRRLARAITDGAIEYLDDLKNRDHEARQSFDAAIDRFISDLRHAQAYRDPITGLRDRILHTHEVRAYVDRVWGQLRESTEAALEQPHSRLRRTLPKLLRAVGTAIASDPELQTRMDQRIEAAILALVVPWRKDIGQFVAGVVRGWDAGTIVDRIELAVGKDLQFIRVNGTLVGAAVGCAIFLIPHLLR